MGASAISKVLSSSARPLSPVEFANALFSTWGRHNPYERRRTNAFGLAISGGVDSMALAALCSGIQQAPRQSILSGMQPSLAKVAATVLPDLRFQAFVVDHGVRKGSDIEARAVSSILEQLGIQTQILKIAWGTYGQPADLPNFESVARKLRFQVLGRACRDSEIDSLFLAHHQDDQVETVMMRMINGHRMFGLMGMKRDSEIPECHGIHGVHESDGLDTVISQTVAESRSPLSQAPRSKYGFMGPLMTETGGIRVYRPLLGFTKDRLTATCKAANMKWFEDHTNKDPTVTTRNAIRHMYSSHTVPAALTSPSLLNLSEKFEARYNSLLKEANTYLEGAVKTFETRTGTMSIRFPDLDHLSGSLSPSDIKLVAALLLQQVIRFVTPEEHVHLHSLHGAVDRVLPETSKDTPFPKSTAFTVSGVQFRPLHASAAQEGTDKKCEWLISRQPYASTLSNRPNIEISPSPSNSSAEHIWTPWSLYDGRFWIRAQNRCAKLIAIRPFQKEDLTSFKQSLEKEKQALLRDVLKKLAPGDVRWTLPAIVVRETDGRERVLALPTLDVIVPHVQEYVSWVIRYKKVDMERLEGQGSKNESI